MAPLYAALGSKRTLGKAVRSLALICGLWAALLEGRAVARDVIGEVGPPQLGMEAVRVFNATIDIKGKSSFSDLLPNFIGQNLQQPSVIMWFGLWGDDSFGGVFLRVRKGISKWILSDDEIPPDGDLRSGRLAIVLNEDVRFRDMPDVGIHIPPGKKNIRAELTCSGVFSDLYGSGGGSSAFSGLFYGFSGPVQSAPNEANAYERENGLYGRRPSDIFRPIGHLPLGAQIAFLAAFFLGGVALSAYCFNRFGKAIDVAGDGFKKGWRGWLGVLLWGGLCFLCAGIAAGAVTYALSVCIVC